MTAPWINEDRGGYADPDGDYVPGPDDFIDDPDEYNIRRRWPEALDAAMLCQHCNASVAWRQHRDLRTRGFVCPECSGRRPSNHASGRLRRKVGERDGWICHRCQMTIDPSLAWPHPLAAVADHHPVTRNDGGPPIAANLKIAHSLCNGNTACSVDRSWHHYPPDQRLMLEAIVKLPLDRHGHVRVRA
ncbi:MAG: hypothetical protein J2P28_01095 [Actinobacteria bacterium]|nr:hypothetical protein [Actinomycetota bacterium]